MQYEIRRSAKDWDRHMVLRVRNMHEEIIGFVQKSASGRWHANVRRPEHKMGFVQIGSHVERIDAIAAVVEASK